ncbi:AN1-type zinc finger and ubiquitin domain-containing protein 1 [Paragonimus heterotremus]|uniref:AN1-type zinc finger and ubiquitin domain-containing protein 1 n=1 Tax=Paragonimus heterotremus TaxID=100268 RepID=A0A8J4SQI5_9TREM|nr:AN1-type zinc finger and ubiquitin domain-containing protein 1 [Paragonimus heterotremus]
MLMDLFIETLTGVSFELRVSPTETIMSIKSKIQRAEGIPVTQQHLIWQDGELDDHRRLRDYSISGGSTIRLVLGLRGGPLNAHRVPPLRLTPIQLTPSTPPKYKQPIATCNGRISHLSRFNLPTLAPSRMLPKYHSDSMYLDSTKCLSSDADGKKSTNTSNPTDHTTHAKVMLPGLSTHQTEDQSTRNVKCNSNDDALTLNSGHAQTASDASEIELNRLTVKSVPADEETRAKPSTNRSSSPSSESASNDAMLANSKMVPLNSEKSSALSDSVLASENSSALNNGDLVCEHSVPEQVLPPLGYPPLLFSTGISRPSYNSYDFSSYWRLYEPQPLASVSKSFVIRNPFPVVSTTNPARENTPPGTASECESSGYTRISKPNLTSSTERDGDDFSFPRSNPSAGSSALFTSMFSTSGDQLRLPCQTSGNEKFFGQSRYTYHWLRRTSPLLEESEPSRPSVTSVNLWGPEDVDEEDGDESSNHLFGADTERDEDDLDDDDDDSVEVRGAHTYGLDDDDDSLADLEDYLFYYRTGDLLFGPPSLNALYPPYSCYLVRDTCAAADLEADFGVYTTHTTMDTQAKRHPEPTWQQERCQLEEKVNDLKNRMEALRIRRRGKQRLKSGEAVKETSAEASENRFDKNDVSCVGDPDVQLASEFKQPSSNQVSIDALLLASTTCAHRPNTLTVPSRNPPKPTTGTVKSPGPVCHKGQRRRRFGTVTPPELKFLVQSPIQDNLEIQNKTSPRHPITSPPTEPDTSAILTNSLRTSMPAILAPLSPRPNVRRPLSSVVRSFNSTRTVLNTPTALDTTDVSIVQPSTFVLPGSFRPKPPVRVRPPLLATDGESSGSTNRPRTSAILSYVTSLSQPEAKSLFTPINKTTRLRSADESRRLVPADISGSPLIVERPELSCLPPLKRSPTASNEMAPAPRSPPKTTRSPNNSIRRKRCALCLRRIGIVNSYSCRCGRNFCSRHRYAEVHGCPFDYKAEARRALIDSNPVVTAPKLPKI